MKRNLTIVILLAFLFISGNIFAEDLSGITFLSSLKMGDISPAVVALQKVLNSEPDTRVAVSGVGSSGNETNYFGALTKNAVIRFQEKYKSEVLFPAGLSNGTGFVGAMTIKKLNQLAKVNTSVVANQVKSPSAQTPYSSANNSITPSVVPPPSTPFVSASNQPVIISVSPEKVNPGDIVTVTGKNFMPVGNVVFLGDGPIKQRFDSLTSIDGKTLSFVYRPPSVRTMSVAEIEALPASIVSQIETPIKEAGLTLEKVIEANRKINSETAYKDALIKNGRSGDEMYHYFHIIVQNSNGTGISGKALLYGLRDLPSNIFAKEKSPSFLAGLGNFFKGLFVSEAYAQLGMNGGGFTSGIIMICTCSGAVMTFQIDFSGGGSGLYVFNLGFVPNAGSGRIAGPWLGGYLPMAGQCWIFTSPITPCLVIPGNLPQNPGGYAF